MTSPNNALRLEIKEVPWTHPDSISLRNALQQDLARLYNMPDLVLESGAVPTESDMAVFFIAYITDSTTYATDETTELSTPVACAGLRALPHSDSAGDAEIKRMYVREEARGAPFWAATALLAELETWAVRERVWKRLVLGTGYLQKQAIRLYLRQGYSPVEGFGSCVDMEIFQCFGKDLV